MGETGSCYEGQGHTSKSLMLFSLDGRGCVPHLLRPNYGRGNEDNGDLPKDFSCIVVFSASDPAAGHCRLTPLLETPGHSQARLAQPLVWTLFLSPGSWCAQGFVCALQESVSPLLWTFCNQIPLASKVIFPGGYQSLCQIPRLGNLLLVLELSQQCENLFCIIVLQFVGCLLGGSMLGLMVTSSKRAYATHCVTQVCCSQSPCPHSRPPLTQVSAGTNTQKSGSVSVGFLGPGGHKVLFEPSEHLWQVWGLILNVISSLFGGRLLCPWMWGIFFWWDPTFSCRCLFSSELQICSSRRRR